jgi:hypothetical protein
MNAPNCTTQAPAQADAGKNNPAFPPQPAVELQVRRLRRRFTLAPAVARALASLCWGGAA